MYMYIHTGKKAYMCSMCVYTYIYIYIYIYTLYVYLYTNIYTYTVKKAAKGEQPRRGKCLSRLSCSPVRCTGTIPCYRYMHVCVCVYVFACMSEDAVVLKGRHMYVCTCQHPCMSACLDTYTHTCIPTYIYTHIYTGKKGRK